jgi:hypothetical protein
MFHDVLHKILPSGQNKCSAWENLKFPANRDGIYPRSLEEVAKIHPELSSSWNG